jgi:hypothetical protein
VAETQRPLLCKSCQCPWFTLLPYIHPTEPTGLGAVQVNSQGEVINSNGALECIVCKRVNTDFIPPVPSEGLVVITENDGAQEIKPAESPRQRGHLKLVQ